MALLSFSPAVAKGSSSTVTLDKTELLALPEISGDTYWNSGTNIDKTIILYESTAGKQTKILVFNYSETTPTTSISFTSNARDVFQIKTIILTDLDGGEFVLNRSEFLITTPGLSSLDIDFGASPPSYGAAVLTDNPYLFYRFQETSGTSISDSSGNNRDATITLGSGLELNQAGPGSSKSIAFDGVVTKIVSNATHSFNSPFSIECWIKTSLNQTASFVSHHATFGSPGWTPELGMNNVAPGGVIESYVFGNGSLQLFDPIGGWNDDTWHHVVLTVGPTNNHCIYIDGVLAISGGNANHSFYDFSWVIGQSSNRLSSSYFQGNIAEVAVYETELSAARIAAHYAAANITPPASYQTEVLADDPWLYWELNDAISSSTAADSSGNGRAGDAASLYGAVPATFGISGKVSTAVEVVPVYLDPTMSLITSSASDPGFFGLPFSIELWIKTTATNISVVTRSVDRVSTFDEIFSVDNLGYLEVGTGLIVTPAPPINDGSWHHIVLTHDPVAAIVTSLYIDGSLTATSGLVPTVANGYWLLGWPLRIGTGNGPVEIDEFAVYDTALSAARVLAHYNAAP